MELTEKQQGEYKRILVRTLQAFDKFCTDHNLRYFATGGTAIGAVRHKGIIPWDDDIDVAMIREDYDRFLSLKPILEKSEYKIISPSDDGYYLPFAKFVNTATTIWELEEHEFVIGVFIDVFPLNHVQNNILEIRRFQKRYLKVCASHFDGYNNIFCKKVLKNISFRHPGTIVNWLKCLFLYKPLKKFFCVLFWKYEEKLKNSRGDFLLNYYTPYTVEKEVFKSEWFDSQIRVPFEDAEISLMNGYEEYLSQMFGDYMTPPPIEKQVTHHSCFYIDLNKKLPIDEIKKVMRK